MMKSLTTAAAFIAFMTAIHVGIRHVYVDVLLSQEFPIQRDRDYVNQKDVRMLLVGNSLVRLDIGEIEGAYNLASFDESYATTYYRLRDLLNQDEHSIDVVLMQLSLHSFRSLRPVDTQQEYWARLVDYPDLIRATDRPIELLRDAIRYRGFPYTGGITRLLEYRKQTSPKNLEAQLAHISRDFSTATDQFTQAVGGAHRLCKADRTVDEATGRYFKRILDLCEQRGVRVVLVRFPITRVHHEVIAGLVDLNHWQRIVDEQLQGADGVEVIDFMELYFDDYSKFMDPVHLNSQAKQAFTDTLKDELSKRGLLPAVAAT